MHALGPGELLLVSVALLIIFSAGRLASFGDALGRLVRGKPRDAK
jgi:Sec-independent protein translocase protein TatA